MSGDQTDRAVKLTCRFNGGELVSVDLDVVLAGISTRQMIEEVAAGGSYDKLKKADRDSAAGDVLELLGGKRKAKTKPRRSRPRFSHLDELTCVREAAQQAPFVADQLRHSHRGKEERQLFGVRIENSQDRFDTDLWREPAISWKHAEGLAWLCVSALCAVAEGREPSTRGFSGALRSWAYFTALNGFLQVNKRTPEDGQGDALLQAALAHPGNSEKDSQYVIRFDAELSELEIAIEIADGGEAFSYRYIGSNKPEARQATWAGAKDDAAPLQKLLQRAVARLSRTPEEQLAPGAKQEHNAPPEERAPEAGDPSRKPSAPPERSARPERTAPPERSAPPKHSKQPKHSAPPEQRRSPPPRTRGVVGAVVLALVVALGIAVFVHTADAPTETPSGSASSPPPPKPGTTEQRGTPAAPLPRPKAPLDDGKQCTVEFSWPDRYDDQGFAAILEAFNASHREPVDIGGGNYRSVLAKPMERSWSERQYRENWPELLRQHPGAVFAWPAGMQVHAGVVADVLQPVLDVYRGVKNNLTKPARDMIARQSCPGNVEYAYSIPFKTYPWALYYRKDILKGEYGLDAPPRKWDEFIDLLDRMAAEDGRHLAFAPEDKWTLAAEFAAINIRLNGSGFHLGLMRGTESWTG